MNIAYHAESGIFKLDTEKTSYIIALADKERFIGHAYYGKKISDTDLTYLLRTGENPFVPSKNNRDRSSFFDTFPMEFPGCNTGDYRESAIEVIDAQGHNAVELIYKEHRIMRGKPGLPGLPATFGGEEECMTLEIDAEDKCLGMEATLRYSIFADSDIVARSVSVKNCSENSFFLTRIMSASVDMDQEDYKLLTLHGSWARERHMDYREIGYGKQSVGSTKGESSHQEHPFMALVSKKATQESGNVYGSSTTGRLPIFRLIRKSCFLSQEKQRRQESKCLSWMTVGSVIAMMTIQAWGTGQ